MTVTFYKTKLTSPSVSNSVSKKIFSSVFFFKCILSFTKVKKTMHCTLYDLEFKLIGILPSLFLMMNFRCVRWSVLTHKYRLKINAEPVLEHLNFKNVFPNMVGHRFRHFTYYPDFWLKRLGGLKSQPGVYKLKCLCRSVYDGERRKSEGIIGKWCSSSQA